MSLTIGQHLKQAREERYITLEKAADETRIRIVFIKALESDDYSVMPSAAQGRGFLRNYADYLNLNIDEVIAEMQRNAPPPEEFSGPLPQANLPETSIPPLTELQEKRKLPPFWTSWFARLRKKESPAEAGTFEVSQEEIHVPVPEADVELPKSNSRKKKNIKEAAPQEQVTEIKVEAETPPAAAEQVEVKDEAKPNLPARLAAFFKIRLATFKPESEPEMAEVSKPVVEPEPKPAAPAEPAGVIFAEVGRKLRERRELISLTIDEVERHTHMRAALVRAMEEGAFDKLPSPVQTRGMLANYAAFLDLDPDIILLRFADALQARRREKYAETPREKIQTEVATSMPFLRSFIAGDLIFGIVMIAVILALAVWGIGRVAGSREAAQATAPSIVDVLAGTPLPTPSVDTTFIPVNEAPIATNAFGLNTPDVPTPGTNINVVISVFAVERTFVRVSVDGEVAFEGRIVPREAQIYEAENQVEVLTGNAAALRISYNGRDLGLMGNIGEVVSRVYTIAGVVTPTATIPPTPTETLFVTVTPTATPTRTATPESTATP